MILLTIFAQADNANQYYVKLVNIQTGGEIYEAAAGQRSNAYIDPHQIKAKQVIACM